MNIKELLSKLWAKSDGTTIREHTDKLLENLRVLKELFGDKIRHLLGPHAEEFWEALRLACEYHDYGKVYKGFQKKVGNPEFKKVKNEAEVRHNLISPAFLPEELPEPLKTLVTLAIVHHHDYEPSDEVVEKVKNILKDEFGKEMSRTHLKVLKVGESDLINRLEEREGRNLKTFYTLLKGFLLRIDHASSSHFADSVETSRLEGNEVKVEDYLKTIKNSRLNDLQEFVCQNVDKNLLITASTGYGKTEAGFIFLKDKGFFTVPIRTSANAIYERAKEVFGMESVGLLHSTAFLYLVESYSEDRNFTTDYVVADLYLTRNFGKPLIVSTPDQLMPFILRPKGFEKYYSMFSYARLVLDEVQLFEPHTLGFIVKALGKINEVGGRVMVMTATLPSYVRKDLESIDFTQGTFLTSQPRHHIRLIRDSILSQEGLSLIKRLSQEGKVLIITNTRARALELRERLGGGNLLHSQFIYRDRKEKEKHIDEFFKGSEKGLWITTQIAEVSLDLDADFLITELSTIDSLIQRMGRANRRGRKEIEEPNVFVFTEDCSGIGPVYRKSIHEITKRYLPEGILSEEEKLRIIEKVYEEVERQDGEYMNEYEKAKSYIDSLWNIEEQFSKKKAQQMFRDILSVSVIPEAFREEVEPLIEEYRSAGDHAEKLLKFSEITGYILSVPAHVKSRREPVKGLKEVYWMRGEYSSEFGFEPEEELDSNII
ncbi:CRISPR-associated Cas3 family helicase [Hydrogenivirga caldilitoris]|uniref:CRISPR-associated Cas3 family helicase n=1 Tax=Hydrogenivirga caldilitoris TaxID=246264 RepID=A0A497XRH9_9AQUI|nr:CRISPR-associated helicase Cas3' [Hydrogenivirga caldilitoris]RLJ70699.1 CRISPR-associated Cas3 family helicase [Hydrogenivirga caldilitoris]